MYNDDEEGIMIVCPYCGKAVLIPMGYNRDKFLCPRCHKAIPLDAGILERLRGQAETEKLGENEDADRRGPCCGCNRGAL